MTILAALNGYYDRLAARDEAAPYGYSYENISYAIELSENGKPVGVTPLIDTTGKKPRPKRLRVPQPTKRTSGIAPNFLWDKTSYVLGVSGSLTARTSEEHAAFRRFHEECLGNTSDIALRMLLRFLGNWQTDQFERPPFFVEMLDANLVFRMDGEHSYLHDRPAAQAIWANLLNASVDEKAICLVTGEFAPVARLHPAIKGVSGAQSSGGSIVSFNLDAFTSYGKEQGANAQISEHAAFGYTSALNKLLERDSRNRIQVGDATTVFWAAAHDKDDVSAGAAESLFATLISPPAPDDVQEAAKVRDVLEKIEKGRPLAEAAPGVKEGTCFYVLGLSPNAARLSVRFWYEGTLGDLADRFREHWRALNVEPTPWGTAPAVWRLLYETAVQRKTENIPPLLAGELMRAILTGAPYPRALLSAVIVRLRADHNVNGMRAAICKACLIRNKENVPVSLDRTERNPGYRLGRLFAVLESAQRAALGKVNATIRDRYYGAASATPGSIFPVLLRNAGHHLSNLRKDKAGLAHWFEKEIGEIVDGLSSSLPCNLRIEDQGRFAVGYYHQRFTRRDDEPEELTKIDPKEEDDGEE